MDETGTRYETERIYILDILSHLGEGQGMSRMRLLTIRSFILYISETNQKIVFIKKPI